MIDFAAFKFLPKSCLLWLITIFCCTVMSSSLIFRNSEKNDRNLRMN